MKERHVLFESTINVKSADPASEQSKAGVYDRSLVGIAGSIPPGHGCSSLVSALVSAHGRLLAPRSTTECGVAEYDCDASIMMRPWPTTSNCASEEKEIKVKSDITLVNHISSVI
jgi:hypothetical protein